MIIKHFNKLHSDFMGFIKKLCNLPDVEEVNTQIVLDKIKEDTLVVNE